MQKAEVDLTSVLFATEVEFLGNFQLFSERILAKKLIAFPISIQSSIFSQQVARNVVEMEGCLREMGFCLNQFPFVLLSTASDLITEMLYTFGLPLTFKSFAFVILEGKKPLGRPRRRWGIILK